MGAYLSVISALGLALHLKEPQKPTLKSQTQAQKIPAKIRLADYKQLKRLAWQLKGTQTISPQEAIDLYERNWRHVDVKKLAKREREFLRNLLAAFGRERLLV